MSFATYLQSLERAAVAAADAEHAFKVEAEARTRALAAARAEAFRRMNFLKALAPVLETATSAEEASGAAQTYLRNRLGWDEVTPARRDVMDQFAPVALAIHRAVSSSECEAADLPPSDPSAAMATFEAWYAATRETSFWYLFEHYMPETPLVDF
ncbi:MAG: hypothetical protein AB1592_01305 [Pseudomonadota bacterium]